VNLNHITETILLLSIAGAFGIIIGRIRIFNVSIGVGGVLFSSLILGHFGFKIEREMIEFLRDAGLAFFVYTIGIQIGPVFFESFKKNGLKLNFLAMIVVTLAFILALIIKYFTRLDIAKIAGIMSGAVTNTPGLAAAQTLIAQADGNLTRSDICGVAYAVTYPFGIFGIIIAIILLKKIFSINLEEERKLFSKHNNSTNVELLNEKTDIFALFVGISAGIMLGAIPIKVPGFPIPIKLGSAGGPLLVALVLGNTKKTGPITWTLPLPANLVLRELGIIIFLACVGLRSGAKFVESIVNGEGIIWMLLGSVITFIPIFLIGLIGIKFFKLNFFPICGLLSGAMTDPPAMSFSEKFCNSEIPALSFTTVYALTMFLRIIYAQILVIFFQ